MADALNIKAETVGVPLAGLQKNLSRGMGRMLSAGMKFWGQLIDEEFAGGFWYMPGGGTQKWKPVEAFGDVPANPTPLVRSGTLRGRYRAATAGGGALSVSQNQGKAEIKVNVPGGYGVVHRGGAGKLLSGDIEDFKIAVTDKMRGYVGWAKNVHMRAKDGYSKYYGGNRPATEFVIITRRPHATSNPKIRGKVRYLAARWGANKPADGMAS